MKFYDDDMDELFNKAGRDYPLKTEPKNWDAVRGALHQEDGAEKVTQKRNGWKRLLPLLFLLMIPAVYVFVDKDNINSQQPVKDDALQVTKKETAITNNNNYNNDRNKVEDNKKIDNKTESSKAENNNVAATEKKGDKIIDDRISKNSDREESRFSYVPPSKQTLRNVTQVEEGLVDVKGGLSGPPQAGNGPVLWMNFPALNTVFNSGNEPSEVISLNTPFRSLQQSNESASVPNSDKKNKNRKGPYIGLIAAPDFSTIKAQQVKGVGYSAGAIVGYAINNRWQVEAGAMWSRKRYYTEGKYFDKKGPGIPDYVNILWLDGGCEMFEFPVVARYNFSEKRNTFFASAGLTSYLMKKEDYNYLAKAGAYGNPYEGYRSYDRSGDHLFANLQMSAGYNFSLSSKLNIRIEPYLKAPLKKIGIGKMPVTSTGLYFAITRDFR